MQEEVAEEKYLSPADKRRLEAEKRAAWREARLRSLENVSVVLGLPAAHRPTTFFGNFQFSMTYGFCIH